MDRHAIFSATLGLCSPWHITSVSFSSKGKRLEITVEYDGNVLAVCPRCGANGSDFDICRETWHHHDFFQNDTLLHARVPQITCSKCGPVSAERPWSRAGSRFTRLS